MILNDTTIYFYGDRLVQPFQAERVQPASYDLALGNEFIRFEQHENLIIDMTHPEDCGYRVNVDDDTGFILQAGEFALGCTSEIVSLPADIVARLEGKSSIGRKGLMIHVTAGFVDPGWHGRLTLEIYNLRRNAMILHPGQLICQIAYSYLFEKANRPYHGRYQGDTTVVQSKIGVS